MRVQWKHPKTRGWNNKRDLPLDTVYVGRGKGEFGRWGNPFKEEDYGRDEAVRLHRAWLLTQPELVERARSELTGRHLACWCKPDELCHADTLIEIANSAGTS